MKQRSIQESSWSLRGESRDELENVRDFEQWALVISLIDFCWFGTPGIIIKKVDSEEARQYTKIHSDKILLSDEWKSSEPLYWITNLVMGEYSTLLRTLVFWNLSLKFIIVPLVSNAKRKILKSNKSELWNRFSYRGLPYFFEVGSQTFRNDYKRACGKKCHKGKSGIF